MNSALTQQLLTCEHKVKKKLIALGGEHLIAHFEKLDPHQKKRLQKQIQDLDPKLISKFLASDHTFSQTLQPFEAYSLAGNLENHARGKRACQKGQVALVVLAGGQGSRLRCKGAKGSVPVSNIERKSLFQILAEKIRAASIQANHPLEVAIMTSPLNHVEVQAFFAQNAFFGLRPNQVTFFSQKMWPFLNFDKKIFLETPEKIAQGPNGNGGVFHRLYELGIYQKWKDQGIECVNIIPIDNPLADPFDFELFGFHQQQGSDVTIKAARRLHACENVGVVATVDHAAQIIEYIHLTDEEKSARDTHGNLKFGIANLGLYCISLEFIQTVYPHALPCHKVQKIVRQLNKKGITELPKNPNAWKFEEFIFDAFQYANHTHALLYPREICFAPLKNLEGADSIGTVQEALLAFDRKVFAHVTGISPDPQARFELSAQFHYPTPALLKKWKGKELPDKEYIDE